MTWNATQLLFIYVVTKLELLNHSPTNMQSAKISKELADAAACYQLIT